MVRTPPRQGPGVDERGGPAEHESHYNGPRPITACQLRPPRPDRPVANRSQRRIKRRPVPDCLLNEYERAA
jgi:putative transposase